MLICFNLLARILYYVDGLYLLSVMGLDNAYNKLDMRGPFAQTHVIILLIH